MFDSNAILLYLAEKSGKSLPANTPKARGERPSWLMFVATEIGAYSGQLSISNSLHLSRKNTR